MSPSPVRAPVVSWLYNHNPFYAISAVLMLFAVRSAYGELRIGTINCWIMMGVLAGYTSLLALIGVLIVRKGKVWEDARSILLLLLLLFLAVSISADDLFVNMESAAGGALLLLVGFVFSVALTEVVLRTTGIRLGAAYRIPYHLLLLLFYAAPWWCSPALHPRSAPALEWTIFLFPLAAAGLLLFLLPAVRRGPAYVAGNGTPWNWPWFPWTAFGVIVGAVALRTFALCMTFGPTGPIWIDLPSGGRAIAFDTMWGPYFLIPPALAVLLLLLEGGLATGNQRLLRRVLLASPLLLVLAWPYSHGAVFRGFLQQFTSILGSPIWLAVCLQAAFLGWAWWRGVRGAGSGALASAALLTVVGPRTLGLSTFMAPQPWPLLAIGAVLLFHSIRARSSWRGALASAVLAAGVWLVLPATPLSGLRMTTCYHLLWAAVIVLGLAYPDRFAVLLRIVGAAQMPLASIVVMISPRTAEVPIAWRLAYVVMLAVLCIAIAKICRSRWYLYAFTSLLAIGGYGVSVLGFRGAVGVLGRAAMTSFAWSAASLLLAFLISAHKAHWLPPRLFPRWSNGHAPPPTVSTGDENPDPGAPV